jgi:thioredoxin reductase
MSGHTHRQAITAAGTGRAATLDAECWLASHATAQPEGTIR